MELTQEQLGVLRQYKDTGDGNFLQELRGASELYRPLGLLDFRGEQYGSRFYSITEKGTEVLKEAGL